MRLPLTRAAMARPASVASPAGAASDPPGGPLARDQRLHVGKRILRRLPVEPAERHMVQPQRVGSEVQPAEGVEPQPPAKAWLRHGPDQERHVDRIRRRHRHRGIREGDLQDQEPVDPRLLAAPPAPPPSPPRRREARAAPRSRAPSGREGRASPPAAPPRRVRRRSGGQGEGCRSHRQNPAYRWRKLAFAGRNCAPPSPQHGCRCHGAAARSAIAPISDR